MKKRGFTLIELAIVLTIIGLMVGGSFKMLKMMRERAKTQEAKEQVQAAKNAVLGDVLKNLDLGLPDSTYFKENLSPSKDLNHPIFYAASSNLQGKDICAYNSTDLEIVTPDGNRSVAFVIAHEGANYNLQTGRTGNIVNIYEPSATKDDNTTYMNNAGHEYDDIVEWVTLAQLKDEIGCADKPFRFLNDKLPNATQYREYNATLYVENNVSSVNINCEQLSPSNHNIVFDGVDSFNTDPQGPQTSGVAKYRCTATETPNSNRNPAKKEFAITIDPATSGYVSDDCNNSSNCISGYCAGGICTTGVIGEDCDVSDPDGGDGDCKSGICYNGNCSGGFVGNMCNDNTQCVSGPCEDNNCTDGGAGSTGGSGSGDDDNGSGGGGGGAVGIYIVSSVSNGSYTLDGGSCKTGTTADVASGTYMEIFKYSGCDNWWLQNQGFVENLDSNGDNLVSCDSSGNCN